MFNNTDKIRVTDDEAEELIRAKRLKPLYVIRDGVREDILSPDDRAILYGEAVWLEANNPRPYKMMVKEK